MGKSFVNQDFWESFRLRRGYSRERDQMLRARRIFRDTNRNLGDKGFMAVADNGVHSFEPRQFLGRALRVAASDNNPGQRIQTAHPANEGASGSVGLCRNTARVQHHELGRIEGCRWSKTLVAQPGGNCLSIRAAGPATEILNVVSFHIIESINATLSGG
jgi:hypothetical protein